MGENINQFNYSDNDLNQSGGFGCGAVNEMVTKVTSMFGSKSDPVVKAIENYDLRSFNSNLDLNLAGKSMKEQGEYIKNLMGLLVNSITEKNKIINKGTTAKKESDQLIKMLDILKGKRSGSKGGFTVFSETLTEDLVTENGNGNQSGTLTENSTEQFLNQLVQNLNNESEGGYSDDDGHDTEELIQIANDKLFNKNSQSKYSTNDLISLISSKVQGYLGMNGQSQSGGNCDSCGCDNNYSVISELYTDNDGAVEAQSGGYNNYHYTDFSETQTGLSESSYYGNPLGGYDTPSYNSMKRKNAQFGGNMDTMSATNYDVDYMNIIGQSGGFNIDNFSATSYDGQYGGYNANDFSATSYDIDYMNAFDQTNQKGGLPNMVNSDFSYNQYNNNVFSATSYDVDYENQMNMVGGDLSENLDNLNTEQLMSRIRNELESNGQQGGSTKNNRVYGERSIATASVSTDVTSAVNEQTDKVYQNIIKKIDDILTGEMKKKNSELKDLVTKAGGYHKYMPYVYKTAIRSQLKKDNPDLKSELDVAIEIDKMINLEKLLSVKIDFWVKELAGYIEKLKKRDSGESKPASKDKKKTATKAKKSTKKSTKKESEESFNMILSSDISSSSI